MSFQARLGLLFVGLGSLAAFPGRRKLHRRLPPLRCKLRRRPPRLRRTVRRRRRAGCRRVVGRPNRGGRDSDAQSTYPQRNVSLVLLYTAKRFE